MAAQEADRQPQAQAQPQPRGYDKQIWGIYIALVIISIIELYSASSHEVDASNVLAPVIRHVIFLAVGLAIMFKLQSTHYSRFLKWSYIFAIASVLAMIYTLGWGLYINGARRAFSFFGLFNLQPAEMVKISAALVIAAILSRPSMKKNGDVTNRGLAYVTGAVLLASGLLFTQGLTNTLLLMGISLSMMIIGGVSVKKMGVALLIFLAAGAIGVLAKMAMGGDDDKEEVVAETLVVPGTDIVVGVDSATTIQAGGRLATWVARIERHFKPDKYLEPINDKNQQEMYSYMAQAHGGVLGVFPGNSRETSRLPLAFSDYIYAIIVEEGGLLGGLLVMVLYLWLLARAGRIANRCQTAYPALLAIGMAVFITLQAMFHMAIVTGFFPVSGQPLPLISKGGTSIIITSIALGVMLSVSRFAARKNKKAEIKEELSVLPDEVATANPT